MGFQYFRAHKTVWLDKKEMRCRSLRAGLFVCFFHVKKSMYSKEGRERGIGPALSL